MTAHDRIESLVSASRIKLHIFEPSKRKIWTVVGSSREHWVDPESHYCSCRGYYFAMPDYEKTCYHLDAVRLAIRQDRVETVRFSDVEFSDFVYGLVSDM